MVHFAEINQAFPPYSMLQHIGRVATPMLLSNKLSQILANNIDNNREDDCSHNLCEVL